MCIYIYVYVREVYAYMYVIHMYVYIIHIMYLHMAYTVCAVWFLAPDSLLVPFGVQLPLRAVRGSLPRRKVPLDLPNTHGNGLKAETELYTNACIYICI